MTPRGFDFARRAWFLQIGATGVALGRCRPTDAAPPPDILDRVALQIAAMRRDLTETIIATAPTEGGAIAAALITGDRSFMSEETNIAFRDSGLGHLLSVSGLHMALVAGGIYAALHFVLALIAPLALRFPVRKWAAASALAGVGAYLVVSGASVPAQRAFVMTAVSLGAVLLDRPAFSMHGLGVAAVIVVALAPESVVEPGFQMSFAATAALIAGFERDGARDVLPRPPGILLGGLDSVWRGLSAMLVASLVAGLATDIFALFHFQRVTVYGLASNVASTPLISFVIAPAAVLAAALAPFGLADGPLVVMAGALDMVAAIGRVFADRPEAVRLLPLVPTSAFLVAVGALVWACLWRGSVRWFAAPVLICALVLYVTSPKPVVWADGDLNAVVARTSEGWIVDARARRADFAKGRLGGMAGLSAIAVAKLGPPDACGENGCRWQTPTGRHVIRMRGSEALAQSCQPGAIILSDVSLDQDFRRRCRPALVLDPQELERRGGAAIIETARGIKVLRAMGREPRPWSGRVRRIDG
jgi:competence protein ComEC